jgi:hypothetical protein
MEPHVFAQALPNGGPGNALDLNGTNAYAQAPNGIWFSGDFTVKGWVFVRSYNPWSRLIDFANGPTSTNVYLALTMGSTGYPAMGVFSNVGSPVLVATNELPLAQWAHLAMTLQGTTSRLAAPQRRPSLDVSIRQIARHLPAT